MRKLLAALLTWALLASSPAFAGIAIISGTGTNGAQDDWSFSGTSSVTQTLTASVAANSLIVVIASTNTNGVTSVGFTCTDSKSNTYTVGTLAAQTSEAIQILWTVTASPMTTSDTVTCTQGSSQTGLAAMIMSWSGINTSTPLDVQITADSGGANQSSLTVGPTGTLACPGGGANCDLSICGVMWPVNGTPITTDAAYIRIGTSNTGVPWMFGYKLISSTTAAQSCTASSTASNHVSGAIAVFKAASGAATVSKRSLLGAGQ